MSKKRRKKATPPSPAEQPAGDQTQPLRPAEPAIPPIAPQTAAGSSADAAATGPPQIRHPDGRIEHSDVRHETSDVRFRWVLAVILVAIGLGAAQFYWLWIFFGQRERQQRAIDASFYPNAAERSMKLPAEPRLGQLDRLSRIDASDINRREIAREQLLTSYGRTSEDGYVHVPIERAMERVIGELPVRKQSPEDEAIRDNGLLDSGESNSGRMFRGQPRW